MSARLDPASGVLNQIAARLEADLERRTQEACSAIDWLCSGLRPIRERVLEVVEIKRLRSETPLRLEGEDALQHNGEPDGIGGLAHLRPGQVSRVYPISRALTYHLLNRGEIKSVLIHKPGSIRGIRLVSVASIEAYLTKLAEEQRDEKFVPVVAKEKITGRGSKRSGTEGKRHRARARRPNPGQRPSPQGGCCCMSPILADTGGPEPPGRKRRLPALERATGRARSLRLDWSDSYVPPRRMVRTSKVLAAMMAMIVLADIREQKPHPWAALLPPGWSLERAALWRLLVSQLPEAERRRAQARRALPASSFSPFSHK
jgi:hypothetical protein